MSLVILKAALSVSECARNSLCNSSNLVARSAFRFLSTSGSSSHNLGGFSTDSGSTSSDNWKTLAPSTAGDLFQSKEPKWDLLEKFLSPVNSSRADQTKAVLSEVRELFQRHDLDTGSSQVQVAALTKKIELMTDHFRVHKKDKHSRRGLMAMLMKRQKLLKYMRRKEPDNYQMTITRLGLKDRTFIEDKYKKSK